MRSNIAPITPIIPPIQEPNINNNIVNTNSIIGVYGIGFPGLKTDNKINTETINPIIEPIHPNHPHPKKPMMASIKPITPPKMIKILPISLFSVMLTYFFDSIVENL
jgi:hypothetical protein